MGTESAYVTYAPSSLNLCDDQAQFYFDAYVVETGLPCQTSRVTPPVALPTQDPTVCNQGFLLKPGRVVKLMIVLWVYSVASNANYDWELCLYGCVP
jgi:hypothetical protein